MASYTMQLREYVEQASQLQTLTTRERIEVGRQKLFDFDYPLFDDTYRKIFETNFIRNFYMREIGFETEGLFKFQLETWLLINMPYFNKMFESELIEYDPLTNSEMNVSHIKTVDKTQNDNRDKTQNDTRNKTQNDNRDITQIDTTTKHQDETKNTSTSQDSVQTSTIDGTSSSDSTTTNDTVSEKTGTTNESLDNFNRELNSNNPDTRLAITTNDGQGVITYASSIKEENENNEKTSTVNSDGTENQTTVSDTSSINHQDSSANITDTGLEDVTLINNENTSLNSSIDDNLISSSNDTLSSTANDKLVSSINDIEDYVQNRVGKIGVQSYPKLIQEYRQSFLRIEKQIFEEMNELFMLVY